MKTIGSFEAKTHFSRLMDQVRHGESFLVTVRGKPVARIVPDAGEQKHPRFGSDKGRIKIADDFDEPLSDFSEYQ